MTHSGYVRKAIFKHELWDTAGPERYRSLAPMFYRGAAIVILIYDVYNRKSFEQAIGLWVGELKLNERNLVANCCRVLVGNKTDLDDDKQLRIAMLSLPVDSSVYVVTPEIRE